MQKYRIKHNDEEQVVEADLMATAIEETGWPSDECTVSLVADSAQESRKKAKAEVNKPGRKSRQKAPPSPPRIDVSTESTLTVEEWRVGNVCATCINSCPDPNSRPEGAVQVDGKVTECESHSDRWHEKVQGRVDKGKATTKSRKKKETPAEPPTGDAGKEPALVGAGLGGLPEGTDILQQAEEVVAGADEKGFQDALDATINATDMTSIIGEPTEAERKAQENKVAIEQMALEAEVMFLEMGRRMYDARENGDWTILHFESFKEYIEDLKLPMTNSYSWSTRLINIYEYMVKGLHLELKLLGLIGVAKLTRLLPAARKGELTTELIEAAKTLSDLDLRELLGHNVGGGGSEEDMIVCPRCGEHFDAKKATRA